MVMSYAHAFVCFYVFVTVSCYVGACVCACLCVKDCLCVGCEEVAFMQDAMHQHM